LFACASHCFPAFCRDAPPLSRFHEHVSETCGWMPLGFLHVLFLFHQAQHSKFAHGNTGSEKGLKSLVTKTSPPVWTLDFLGKRNATRISLTALLTYWSVLMAALYKFAYQHSIVAVRWAHEARSWRGRWKWIEPYVLVALEPHSTQSRNGSLKGFGRDKNPAKGSFFLRGLTSLGLTSFPPHFPPSRPRCCSDPRQSRR